MTTKIGIRELAKNTALLNKYDYIDIEDKKTNEYKGMFLSPKYAKEFKKYLKEKKEKEIQKKLKFLNKFAGSIEIEDRFKGLSYKEIKAKIAQEKYTNE